MKLRQVEIFLPVSWPNWHDLVRFYENGHRPAENRTLEVWGKATPTDAFISAFNRQALIDGFMQGFGDGRVLVRREHVFSQMAPPRVVGGPQTFIWDPPLVVEGLALKFPPWVTEVRVNDGISFDGREGGWVVPR